MSSSAMFTGIGLQLQSATSINRGGTVRIRFTNVPKQSSSIGTNDALNPNNYTLSGPGMTSPSTCSVVSGDILSIDVNLTARMAAGVWTITAANIQTPTGTPLSSPFSLVFSVVSEANATSLIAGAEQDDPARIIRKHLSPAMGGTNWDALIEALSKGDDINWTNARLAFDQIFKTSASGKYLDRLAANDGLTRPLDVGMSDELFRQLSISLTNKKLTHQALQEILEIFYGQDALHAYVETALEEPFVLTEGQTLDWTIDEKDSFRLTFLNQQFGLITQASAIEVASLITKTIQDSGSNGFAASIIDTETGGTKIRIYSGSRGLKSFVRVTGGTAQRVLQFDNLIDTYSGVVTVGDGYNWNYTNPDQSSTKLTLNTIGTPTIDISTVEIGDYLVIGPNVGNIPEGSYPVLDIDRVWSGATLTQSITIGTDLGFAGTLTQTGNSDYTFFRPTKNTILNGERTVVVSQNGTRNAIDIQIPATTQAVSRGPHTGSYVQEQNAVTITRYLRDGSGTLTLEVDPPYAVAPDVGSHVHIKGIKTVPSLPWVSQGFADTYPGTAETDASYGTTWSASQVPPNFNLELSKGVVLQDGSLLLAGGIRHILANPLTVNNDCNRLLPTNTIAVSDLSEANGAIRQRYQWLSTANLNNARFLHGLSVLADGRALATGGVANFPFTSPMNGMELYNPGDDSWSFVGTMQNQRAAHTQNTLANGKIALTGGFGFYGAGTAQNTVELFDPATLASTAAASMSKARANHAAVVLQDGRLFVIGGQTLGQRYVVDSSTLAYWPIDDLGVAITNAITDITGNYAVTVAAVGGVASLQGKVGLTRQWNASYAQGAGNGAAVTALTGNWTVEFWLPDSIIGSANGAIVAYGLVGADINANNTLMMVGVDASNRVFWKWEHGAGIDVSATQTLGPTLDTFADGVFVAVRKTLGVSTYTVDLLLNGTLIQSWTGPLANNADGGGSSQWYINRDPDTGGGYGSTIDELRVSSVARTDAEILQDFLRSKGWATTYSNPTGDVLASTEFYNPNTNTWTAGPELTIARSHHQAFVLDDGRVLVIGGAGRDLNEALPVQDGVFTLYWPNTGIRLAEIWDPTTNRWSPAGESLNAWVNANAIYLPGKQQIAVTYSNGFSDIGYGASTITRASGFEIFDIQTQRWKTHFLRNTANRDSAFVLANDLAVFTGGRDGDGTYASVDLLVPGADTISAAGINGSHRIAASTTGTITVETPDYPFYASNYGDKASLGGKDFNLGTETYLPLTGFRYPFLPVDRVGGITTLTLSGSATTAGLSIGDSIYVNMDQTSNFTAGLKTISDLTTTTVSYVDAGPNISDSVYGSISVNQNVATVTSESSIAAVTPGPYIFDPQNGLSITGVESTLVTPMLESQNYSQIQVASTTDFPDETGYIVFGFGTSQQSKPVKYLEKVGTNLLLLDFAYVTEHTYEIGTTVTLLQSRSPFVDSDSDTSYNFYATGSVAGQIAARKIGDEAASAGTVTNWTIVYPSDRGLGGEGFPTAGSGKLSDAVRVWGEDK